MVVRAHHLSGRIPQSLARTHSMGVGIFVLRQGRTFDHAKFSVGTPAASVTKQCHVEQSETSLIIDFVWHKLHSAPENDSSRNLSA